MKRTNTVSNALNTGNAILDPGDGLPLIPIPLDGQFPGRPGPAGPGVPEGGTAGQYIEKTSDGSTQWATPSKSKVGLPNVDNTSDANKPISNATRDALDTKPSQIEFDFALQGKADLSGGKVPVSQLPTDALVTDANVAAQVNGAQTGAAIDQRITTQATPLVQPIVADYIASSQVVVDAAAAAVNANPKIAELETAKWYRGDLGSSSDRTTLNTNGDQGRWRVVSPSVLGLPRAAIGYLDVSRNPADGRITHIFTVSGVGPLVQFSSVYSSGVWGKWEPYGWYRGLLGVGTDFHSIKDFGVYGIQFTTHPNQPVPAIGTLEVLPASGNIIHRFTEEASPHYVWTSRFGGTTWSTPVKSGGTGGSSAAINGYSIPARGELHAHTSTSSSKSGAQIMMSMSKDRQRGWNQNTASLSETRDDGATWAQVNDKDGVNPFAGATVESVMELDNQEVLVTCLRGSISRREVWLSSSYRIPDERTYARTMEARAPYVKFTSAWSMSTYENIVLLNEYGPKTPEWSGNPVAEGENARYTYLSTDYGKTWATIFDLNTYLTGTQGRTTVEGQHLHGVAWDPYWDRIWVSFGDNLGGNGSNGIVYSDDFGSTWKTAHFYTGSTPPHQVVGIQPMPKCVLFFGDMGPDVIRIDRSEGKYKSGGYQTPVAFESTASGKHLCQGFMRARREGDDAPTLAVWSSEGQSGPSFAVATMDGYTFKEIWRDTVDNPSGFGGRSIVGPTIRGQVIIGSNDKKVTGMWSEVRAEAPGY